VVVPLRDLRALDGAALPLAGDPPEHVDAPVGDVHIGYADGAVLVPDSANPIVGRLPS
jgi:hypothetical protein